MKPLRIAIVGSGPAGLMAATQCVSAPNVEVTLFEKRAGLGRKLLIAGSSGLNISHECSLDEFSAHYVRDGEARFAFDQSFWKKLITEFGPKQWVQFIEKELKLETFLGTSQRYFVKEMKASGLLKGWTDLLRARGLVFQSQHELVGIKVGSPGQPVEVSFRSDAAALQSYPFDRVILAMGGGSWETEAPVWPQALRELGISVKPFVASNVGYEVKWKPRFLKEAEGKPLKNITLTTSRGEKSGELMVTAYGLEGTPVYFMGVAGQAFIDLKPGLSLAEVENRMQKVKENLSPIRRATKTLNLNETALALLFHHGSDQAKIDVQKFAEQIKRFPIQLLAPRSLAESISSMGGIQLDELNPDLSLKKYPQLFCAGEMLDWDAPTGGFLIQGSVSTGFRAGKSAVLL